MQRKRAFVVVCPEGENTKKEMIDEKIKMETKLANNVLPVVAPLQQWAQICNITGLGMQFNI